MTKENMSQKKEETPLEKFPNLANRFKTLENLKKAHLGLGAEVLSGYLYATDFVIGAVLNRSLNLLSGLLCLVERWNFIAAAPLLRLQIDNLLKLSYLATLKNAGEVSFKIIQGVSFLKLKNKEGKKLTDAMLRDYARDLYPWIDKVYEETSKLIHLSDKHVFHTVKAMDEKTRSQELFIGEGCLYWKEKDIAELLDAMGYVTDALLKNIKGWSISKQIHVKRQ